MYCSGIKDATQEILIHETGVKANALIMNEWMEKTSDVTKKKDVNS